MGLFPEVVDHRVGQLRVPTRIKEPTSQAEKTHANLVPSADATLRPIPPPSFAHVPPRLLGELQTEEVHAHGIRCIYQSRDHTRGHSYMC